MAIINGARATNKDKIKIEINSEVLETIKNYCKWADIDNIDFFRGPVEEPPKVVVLSKSRGFIALGEQWNSQPT